MAYNIQFMIVTVIRDGNWSHEKINYDYAPITLETQAKRRVLRENPKAKAIWIIYQGSLCKLLKGEEDLADA